MSTLPQRKHLKDVSLETAHPESQRIVDTNPYLAGEVISDRYRLTREIGRGGMGVVWVAHSLVLGIDVAVKLIRADAAGPAWASRMAREAQAAARLGHPAMVRVFDFGWTNRGDPFLVMEFVQGDTLAKVIIEEGRLPAIRAVQTLLPIADGLRLAHERGIIHRDIKPDNILLSADGLGRLQPKLLDFGIAKVDQTQADGKLTQVGAVLGSPEYMSPEQARGLDDVDARCDVWSLAISLYEMIRGDVPFRHPNYNALMQSVINDAPPSLTAQGLVDKDLWEIISRALSKSVEGRYSSMSEFGEAMALWLYQHGIKEDLSGNSIRALWLDSPMSQLGTPPPATGMSSNGGFTKAGVTTVIRRSIPDTGLGARLIWLLPLALAGTAFAFYYRPAASNPPGAPLAAEVSARDLPLVPAAVPVAPAEAEHQSAGAKPDTENHVAPATSEKSGTAAKAAAPAVRPLGTVRPRAPKSSKSARDFGF